MWKNGETPQQARAERSPAHLALEHIRAAGCRATTHAVSQPPTCRVRSGMRSQQNGSDCGVFMTRTADYLARDAVLDFSQQDMPYLRRRMVLEVLRTSLLP